MDDVMTAAKYVFARTMIATGAAALTSRATGGDVLQGALTGATVHLFNHEAHIGQKGEALAARAEKAYSDGEAYGYDDRAGNFPPGGYK